MASTGAVVVAGGLLLTVLTGFVAFAVLAVIVVLVVALAGTVGWRVALALTLLGSMVGESCLLRITPALGWNLSDVNLVLWAVAGVAGVAMLGLRGGPAITRTQVESLVFVMLVPVIGVAAYVVKMISSGGSWIAWSMNNDVAFRSLMVRWTLEDNGLTADRGYSDPLTSALFAAWTASDTGRGDLADTTRAIVYSGAQIWILLWLTVSCVSSVIALRNLRVGRGYRALLAIVAGLLPWTWFVSGSSFELGFQNVAASVLVILLAWVLWTQRELQPIACLTGLLLAILATAMAWVPLAPIPLFWAAHAFLTQRPSWRHASWRALLAPAGALTLGLVYAAAVTLRETLGTGTGGLSADGAIQFLSWRWTLGLTAAGLVLSALLVRRLSPTHRWGFWLATTASCLVAAYLLYQRRNSATMWGYYPIKFTWLAVSSALLIFFGESAGSLRKLSARFWSGNGVVLAAALVLGAMYVITPPWAPGSRFTPASLAQNHRYDRAAESMFMILDEHPKSFVSGFSLGGPVSGAAQDGFVNFWLFQMGAKSGSDPIRWPAYHFDPTDAAAACSAVAVWGSGVEVWTRDRATAKAFQRSCDDVAVRLRGRVLAPTGDAPR